MAPADGGQRGTILLVSPRRGGVRAVADGAADELRRRGWGVDHLRLPASGVPAATALRAVWAKRDALRRADVVHVEFGALDTATFWFGLAATLMRRDVVAVAHDVPKLAHAPAAGLVGDGGRWRAIAGHRVLSPLLDRPLKRSFGRRAGVGVVLSQAAARGWAGSGSCRILTIDHGADPPASDLLSPSSGRHVLFAGYIGQNKGLDVLLDAWAQVSPTTALQLVVAGSDLGGPSEVYARDQLRRSARLANPPIWRGAVTDGEFARLIAEAAVVVLPYRRSNPASGVLVRAMVEGRAIVATRVPAALDALRDGVDALLVPPGDAAALAGALRRLIDDTELRDQLGAAAAERAAARFTWARHVEGLERSYALAADVP